VTVFTVRVDEHNFNVIIIIIMCGMIDRKFPHLHAVKTDWAADAKCAGSGSENASARIRKLKLSLHFNGHFPGEPELAGVYWSKG